MPPPGLIPTDVHICLIFLETRVAHTVIGLHFCSRYYGSVFIHIFVVGSKRHTFAAIECVTAYWIFSVIQGR